MESPKRFRKKPVVIEAIRWDGQNQQAIHAWSGGKVAEGVGEGCLIIPTLEGMMLAQVGDWVIRGVKGEFYPCAPDIFAMTYEAA